MIEIPDKIFGIESELIVSFVPLLGVVLFVLISVNVVIIPKLNDFNDMKNTLTILEDKNKLISEKTQYLQSVDGTELQKNSEFISSALLPQKNAYVLVEVVRTITEKFGYQVDSFLINPGVVDKDEAIKTNNKGIYKIPIIVSLLGPKAAYLDLVKGLEKSLPVLSLGSFKMANEGIMAKLELEIDAFYIEESTKADINKLSLADLTLKKEENDLISTLSEFTINAKPEENGAGSVVEYKKYERKNPFSP